ncbi:MAG: 30S ribosome-binding factor RbfA [Dehalococcoidia bacterium]|nr:30S ribosome-binding factor RbfA [Dehalococcoidia bacterium]
MSRRTEQVNELLKQELSSLLSREVRDPRVSGIVSITGVDVSPDLRRALVWVSVLGSDDDRASTMRALHAARPFLRRELAQRLRLRTMPDLEFESDTTMERAQELTDIMRRNAAERGETL